MCKLVALRKIIKVLQHEETTNQLDDTQYNSATTTAAVRATIDEAYDVIEKQMLESISWRRISKYSKKRIRVHNVRVSYRSLKGFMKKRRIEEMSLKDWTNNWKYLSNGECKTRRSSALRWWVMRHGYFPPILHLASKLGSKNRIQYGNSGHMDDQQQVLPRCEYQPKQVSCDGLPTTGYWPKGI